MITNKKILIGISGCIAAYKVVSLVSQLVQNNNQVKVIMTQAATELVNPNTFRAISKNPVIIEQFADSNSAVPHISLVQECDLMMIVPATANIIAKAAHGIADDILSTTIVACRKPIIFVPAMNSDMWDNPITQNNLSVLNSYGYQIVSPASGYLACGDQGKGRLPELDSIIEAIDSALCEKDLIGKNILITSGGTREYIDDVRMITNASTGKMGAALSRSAVRRGAKVTLVTTVPHGVGSDNLEYVDVDSALDMLENVKQNIEKSDVFISAAAVADYRVDKRVEGKMKKSELNSEQLTLNLVKNPDILKSVAASKRDDQIMVGFSLECSDLVENARKKLESKNLDMIVANLSSAIGANDTDVEVIGNDFHESHSGSKDYIADRILDRIVKFL